jgi:phage gpG-like protein
MSKQPKLPDFGQMADEVMNNLAKDVANQALKFFQDSFEKEGFTDINFIPWVQRLSTESDHPLLNDTGTLKNSLHISQQTPDRIEIETDQALPYAEIHNTGGTIKVVVTEKMKKYFWAMYIETKQERFKFMALMKVGKELNLRIPQRQFIGNSHTLNEELDKLLIKKIRDEVRKVQQQQNT